MSYKIQNRTFDNKRIKLMKRSDGQISFVQNPVPTYQENTIQAGWCMAPINAIPELQDPKTTFELSAPPMGTDGRVSIYRNNTLVSTMRFSNLTSNAEKVTWFNNYFGAVVQMSVVNGIAIFRMREDDNEVMLTFEDDDIDFLQGNFRAATNKTAINVERYRLALAIKISDISCEGALDFAGILTFNDNVDGDVDGTNFITNIGMTSLLTDKGLEVIELQDWVPVPKEFRPRARVTLTEVIPDYITEPTFLTVELSRAGRTTETYSGGVNTVIDQCQTWGILLQCWGSEISLGTEPGTPVTTVKVTLTGGLVIDPNQSPGEFNDWHNPTLEFESTTKFSANLGWDGLEFFWSFISCTIDGCNGEVGDIITNPRNDFHMRVVGTNGPAEQELIDNADYRPDCSGSPSPLVCRQLHQIDTYADSINVIFANTGSAKYIDFNQNKQWAAKGTGVGTPDSALCSEEGYGPAASRWVPGAWNYGYAIPVPELPM